MKTFEKILNVLAKNLGYTIVLVMAITLFCIFSGGLIRGLITAGSALIGYTCIEMLYKQFKADNTQKSAPKRTSKKK